MKKFEFHLEKLLSYKGQVLDSEMMTLAVLNNQLSEAQNKLFLLQTEQAQCQTDYESKMLEKTTPATCRMYIYYGEHLKEQILLAKRLVENIAHQIEKQIETIKKLKQETKSLETLKSTRFDEYNKEGAKAEELQLEEFVTTAGILRKSI
ncbi:MAG: fliJ [Bacillota bacterium]|jgi:flagellar export protein FliJ|nr:fliJ [Bacillota bacterium]